MLCYVLEVSLSFYLKLVEAVQQAEMEKERRFMKGKISSKAYEQLTPHEIRDLRVVFDTFDTDRSGLVIITIIMMMMMTIVFLRKKKKQLFPCSIEKCEKHTATASHFLGVVLLNRALKNLFYLFYYIKRTNVL